MSVRLNENEIAALIAEAKPLPQGFRLQLQLRGKRGHKEQELDVKGNEGHDFKLILRQADSNLLDFSIILMYYPSGSNQGFRLRRYNGKSHQHSNRLESQSFYGFHIHTATERYQECGAREDTFAELTGRYADFNAALGCMLKDGGFILLDDNQTDMFKEVNE